ncbi:MAG: hypothetical protein ABIE23_05780, partial [archaeon]
MKKVFLALILLSFFPLINAYHGSGGGYETWGSINYGASDDSSGSYRVMTFLIDQPCVHTIQGSYESFLCYYFFTQNETEELSVNLSADTVSGCAPLTVNFTATISNGTGPYRYQWYWNWSAGPDIDEVIASAISLKSHNYAIGPYTAKVIITDNSTGKTAEDSLTIDSLNCGGPFGVTLTADPTSACCRSDIDFIATTSDGTGPYTYDWYFQWPSGLNGSYNSASPSYSLIWNYFEEGLWTAKVIVTDNSNNDTAEASVIIDVNDTTISVSPTAQTVGLNELSDFYTADANCKAWADIVWAVNELGGDPDCNCYSYNGATPNGTYIGCAPGAAPTGDRLKMECNTPGQRDIKFSIATACNNGPVLVHAYATLDVVAGLSVDLSANPSSGCDPLDINLTAVISNGTGPYDYNWFWKAPYTTPDKIMTGFASDTNTQSPPAYTPDGTYNAKVVVKDSTGETAEAIENIIVVDCTEFSVILTADPTSGDCAPLLVDFNAIAYGYLPIDPSAPEYGDIGVPWGFTWAWDADCLPAAPSSWWCSLVDVYGQAVLDNNISFSHIYDTKGLHHAKVSLAEEDAYFNNLLGDANDSVEITLTKDLTVVLTPSEGYITVYVDEQETFTGGGDCVGEYSWKVTANPADPAECVCNGNSGSDCVTDAAAGLLEGADLDTLDVYCTTEGDRLITLTTSWSVPGASDSKTDNAPFNVVDNLPPTVDAKGPYFGVINEDFNVSGYAVDPEGDAVNEIEWINIPVECTLVGEVVSGIGTDYADNNAVINCSIRGAKQIKLRAS